MARSWYDRHGVDETEKPELHAVGAHFRGWRVLPPYQNTLA